MMTIDMFIKALKDALPSAEFIEDEISKDITSAHIPGVGFIAIADVYDNLPPYADADNTENSSVYFISEDSVRNIERKAEAMKELGLISGDIYSPIVAIRSAVTGHKFSIDSEHLTISGQGGWSTAHIFERHSDLDVSFNVPIRALLNKLNNTLPEVNIDGYDITDQNEIFDHDEIFYLDELKDLPGEVMKALMKMDDTHKANASNRPEN